MKNIINRWNLLDYFFFEIDKLFKAVKEIQGIPDTECIIEAETKYLKAENESLKALQYPKRVIKSGKNYVCPNKRCGILISSVLVDNYRIKFCPECGQRIYNVI